MKVARNALLIALTLLMLSGCVKVEMDLTVSSNDTISGTAILAVRKDLPTASTLQEQLQTNLPPNATTEPYDDGTYQGVKVTYDRVLLTDFAGQGMDGMETQVLRREGNYFIYGDQAAPPSPPPTVPGMAQAVYRVRMTFPGPVIETNGIKDGNSVEWTNLDVAPYAKAEAGNNWLIPVLIGVASVSVIGVGVCAAVLLIRKRRRAAAAAVPAPAGSAYDPAAFTGAYLGSQEFGVYDPGSAQGSPVAPLPAADTYGDDSGSPWAQGNGSGLGGVSLPPGSSRIDADSAQTADSEPDPWSPEGVRQAEAGAHTVWQSDDSWQQPQPPQPLNHN